MHILNLKADTIYGAIWIYFCYILYVLHNTVRNPFANNYGRWSSVSLQRTIASSQKPLLLLQYMAKFWPMLVEMWPYCMHRLATACCFHIQIPHIHQNNVHAPSKQKLFNCQLCISSSAWTYIVQSSHFIEGRCDAANDYICHTSVPALLPKRFKYGG